MGNQFLGASLLGFRSPVAVEPGIGLEGLPWSAISAYHRGLPPVSRSPVCASWVFRKLSSSAGPTWASRACSIGWSAERLAIVDPTSGVTRDRVTWHLFEIDDRFVELVDTGGMGVEDVDNLTEQIEEQIRLAIDVGRRDAVRGRHATG